MDDISFLVGTMPSFAARFDLGYWGRRSPLVVLLEILCIFFFPSLLLLLEMDTISSLLDSVSTLVTETLTARDNGNGSSASTDNFTVPEQNMRTAWIGLQLAGQISLPILIATLLFHKRVASRNPTIVNLCIVWTLATIPPELL